MLFRSPTQQSYEFYQELRRRADQQLAAWKEIVAKDIAGLNQWMREQNIPAVSVSYSRTDATQEPSEIDR